MNIIFIAGVLAALAGTVFWFLKRDYAEKAHIISLSAAIVLMIFGAVSEPALWSVSIGASLFMALSLALRYFSPRIKKEWLRSLLKFLSAALLVLMLVETVVFNFNSYHLWRGEYNEKYLSMETAALTGFTGNGAEYTANGEGTVEFTGINERIGTIVLDTNSDGYKVDYEIDFTDETNASYRCRTGLVKGSVVKGIDASKYVVCDFSGKVGNLRIKLKSADGQSPVYLRSVKLNLDYPSEFCYGRVLIFILCAVFVYLFRKNAAFGSPLSDKTSLLKGVTAVIILVAVMISLILSFTNVKGISDFGTNDGNQMTKEMVDAFEKGKVELDAVPSEELKAMTNPYDWSARLDGNVSAQWDHVYYNGKYYSYYGAGPVVLVFLPYHMLTGHYFPSVWAGMIFTSLGIVFVGLCFYKLMKKFFPDISVGMFSAALITVLASCGAWYCTVNINFYEIAQSSGFCCIAIGAYFLITSNVIGDGKISRIRILLSSLFLSLAVTCRPTTAVWCVVALAFIAVGALKLKKSGDKKSIILYLVFALVPFAAIGGMQMMYNYARFGSFTDFGIDYSLTINDFTKAEFHTQLAAVGFFDYLFALPSFSGTFPYFTTTLSDLNVNGYYFIATQNGCGLLFRALPVFALFASPFALKFVSREKRISTAVLFALTAVVAPCVIIASVWESGYGVRYMMDFAWEMVTCAFMVIFLFYRQLKSEESRRLYRGFILISMFLAVAVNTALVFSYYYPSIYLNNHEADFVGFARMFSIFKTWQA